jgi:hypothetical protein
MHHQKEIRKTTTFQKEQNPVILKTFTTVGEARYLYSFSNMKKTPLAPYLSGFSKVTVC